MLEPGRQYSTGTQYRYGFNGQEKSDEIGGGLSTAEYWEYDSRIGRRWNLDPKPRVGVSDYSTFDDNPISYDDPNGDCPNCVTAVIGAGIGALLSGGIEIGRQLLKDHKVSNWKAVGGASLQGGITGLVAGFTGGASLAAAGFTRGAAILVTATASGTANVVGGVVNNAVQGKQITTKSVVTDFSVGFIAGGLGAYLGDKLGVFVSKWSKIGSTGKVGEDALKALGGTPQAYFKTPLTGGGRYVDQLVNDIAHESKVGYTSLTADIKTQIAKDVELMNGGNIKGAVWHFFKSPVTKLVGATKPLLDELKKNGITYIIH